MNNFIIKAYIDKLTLSDIYEYAKKEGIILRDNDAKIIYDFIKNKWKDFLDSPEEVLSVLSGRIEKEPFNKIQELYRKYKKRINLL